MCCVKMDFAGINALKEAKDEVFATKEEEARLKNTLEEAESEMHYLKEVLGEAKSESMKLQESLTDKGNWVLFRRIKSFKIQNQLLW